MSNKKYFLSINDKQLGPFNETDIRSLLKKGEINFSNFIFTQGLKSWLHVGEMPEFSERKPVTPPTPPSSPLHPKGTRKDWMIHDFGQKRGPFSNVEIIELLKTKQIRRSSQAYRDGMKSWMPLLKIKDFQKFFSTQGPEGGVLPHYKSSKRSSIIKYIVFFLLILGIVFIAYTYGY